MTVAAQEADAGSMLALYRAALALRRTHPGLGGGTLTWRPAEPGVLAFDRDPGFTCVVNLADGRGRASPRGPGAAVVGAAGGRAAARRRGGVAGDLTTPVITGWLRFRPDMAAFAHQTRDHGGRCRAASG